MCLHKNITNFKITKLKAKKMTQLTCFKAYDVRGRIPNELNEDIVYRIGRAYAQFLEAKLKPKQGGSGLRYSPNQL